jgi:hypothetical protein
MADAVESARQELGELADRAAREQAEYANGEDRPLAGYVGVLGVYAAVMAVFAAVMRLTGRRLPERFDARDLALIAVATHKVSRLIARDPVTSPLRAPFTRYEGRGGPSEVQESVRADGPRKAIGELVTCPFCVGHWVATGFAMGLVFLPRATRFVASVFTTLTASDLLQFAYAAVVEARES